MPVLADRRRDATGLLLRSACHVLLQPVCEVGCCLVQCATVVAGALGNEFELVGYRESAVVQVDKPAIEAEERTEGHVCGSFVAVDVRLDLGNADGENRGEGDVVNIRLVDSDLSRAIDGGVELGEAEITTAERRRRSIHGGHGTFVEVLHLVEREKAGQASERNPGRPCCSIQSAASLTAGSTVSVCTGSATSNARGLAGLALGAAGCPSTVPFCFLASRTLFTDANYSQGRGAFPCVRLVVLASDGDRRVERGSETASAPGVVVCPPREVGR